MAPAGTEFESVDSDDRAKSAHRALDSLGEMEPELKAAAIFAGEGDPDRLLACTGDPGWAIDAAELSRTVRGEATGEFDSAHIALNEGEVFVVAESGYTLVATTGRFVLASLTRFDARMCLRDLAAEYPINGEAR